MNITFTATEIAEIEAAQAAVREQAADVARRQAQIDAARTSPAPWVFTGHVEDGVTYAEYRG